MKSLIFVVRTIEVIDKHKFKVGNNNHLSMGLREN